MLTVDYDRLRVGPGSKVIDVGCGAGRHSFEAYRRGANVIAFDQDAEELANVDTILQAMGQAGEAPESAKAQVVVGDALALPYPDGSFDTVIASEILEHIPDDDGVISELVRVLRPGGTLAVTVPRWLPEKICWLLSDAYHANEGGHIRIYRADELRSKLTRGGLTFTHSHHAHGLAFSVLVAEMRCGRGETGPPSGQGVSQAAGVGHDVATQADPSRRSRAQPCRGQERRALFREAGLRWHGGLTSTAYPA